MYKADVIGVPQQGGLTDPVSSSLWVSGYETWVKTLAIEPGWLGVVYQGQQDLLDITMQKICN